ncbi:MAG: histidine phosphatase family protein [Alphaproteobacteria bacterium]|nr:histidine phosphatase family protein [Alphaproteobacteria bacterium]
MTVRLHLVRHGEAAAAWGDDADPGLSAAGVAQAEAAAATLAGLGATRALTSPLRRCQETAAAFAQRTGLQALIEPDVAEIPTPADVVDRKLWLRELMTGQWPSHGPHAALLSAWRLRILWTLQVQTQDVVIFTHFVAINVALGYALESRAVLVRQPANAAIVTFESSRGRLRLLEGGAEGASTVL